MAECLLPQDLGRWIVDQGAADTVCSLFLSLPSTSTFERYSFVEYVMRLAFVCGLDFLILHFFLNVKPLRQAVRSSFEINLITHPLVFFFMPLFGARHGLPIGTVLVCNILMISFLKSYYFWRYVESRSTYKTAAVFMSLLLAWYSGALIAY